MESPRRLRPFEFGSGVLIAADPSHKGRYAVQLLPGAVVSGGLPESSGDENCAQEVEVVATNNSGSSWTRPTVLGDQSVADITDKPWIAYGPTGVLAALWRNAYPPYNPTSELTPGYQNVFAAVSRNNGKTFSAPSEAQLRAITPTGSSAAGGG